MKKALLGFSAVLALTSLPATSYAQLSFNVGAVSDYRYRGISQSRLKPALQGGVDFAAGGLYLGAWASTIKWIKDAGGDAGVEIDLYAGYKGAIAEGVAYDVGVLSYQYPGHDLAISPVTTEVYGALSFGPATLKYSHSVSNLFGFADSKNSGYLDLSATFDAGGIALTPHVGYQKVSGNSDYSYTDVSFGVSKDFSGVLVSATAVYADTKKIGGAHTYAGPTGKNHAKAGVVFGVKYTF